MVLALLLSNYVCRKGSTHMKNSIQTQVKMLRHRICSSPSPPRIIPHHEGESPAEQVKHVFEPKVVDVRIDGHGANPQVCHGVVAEDVVRHWVSTIEKEKRIIIYKNYNQTLNKLNNSTHRSASDGV